jgi:hypothetical protein
MLIAAAEWWRDRGQLDGPIVFAAFGAGLHWGALLARPARGQFGVPINN